MLYVELDRQHKRSLSRQIYSQIRLKILAGELKARAALPSSREFSKELHVARNTVSAAYDLLISEGFAYSAPCSGVFVNSGAVKAQLPERIIDYSVASLSEDCIQLGTINFDSGIPALELFPRSKWNQTVSRAFMEAPASALGYDDPQGRPELRTVLSGYLMRTRGIHCHPDQIIITSGTKQGLSLTAKCLLDGGSEIWIENPSNYNVRQIFSYHTRHIVPFEVDGEGIRPQDFPEGGKPTLIFVTPSHQFPMGGILPIQRRIKLVRFAAEAGCYLIEDDYDSEFRYDGLPVNSLFELDQSHVIYAGTFSKVMFPSLRLGYLVVPFSLVEKIRELKRLADHHSNSVYQLALMRFIESGSLERHIRHMKKVYQKRRSELVGLLEQYFPGNVTVHGECTGMHIVAEFKGVDFTYPLVERLKSAGIYTIPVEAHSIGKKRHGNQLILGFAQNSRDVMEEGLNILRDGVNWAGK